jgi:soluble lytic murein transglycosylase-like protein
MASRDILILAGLGGVGLWLYSQQAQASSGNSSDTGSGFDFGSLIGSMGDSIKNAVENVVSGSWTDSLKNGAGRAYAMAFSQAERANGLPPYLLARQAWEESRYNPSAYNPSGAIGIMQIIPAYHPGINASDPFASIAFAGNWMASLYKQFGSWTLALMAYNWGPGNVDNFLMNGGNIPAETTKYYGDILGDISTVNGIQYA